MTSEITRGRPTYLEIEIVKVDKLKFFLFMLYLQNCTIKKQYKLYKIFNIQDFFTLTQKFT